MREYPRTVYRGKDDFKRVYNEAEEIQASIEGYESHFDVECIERQRGTDWAILKGVADIKDNSETSIPVIEEVTIKELKPRKKNK